MARSPSDELRYVTYEDPGPLVLKLAMLAGGMILLYKGFTVDFEHTRRVSSAAEGLVIKIMTIAVGAGLSLGGFFLAFVRSGISFDRTKGVVFTWTSYGPFRTQSKQALADFDRVLIGRGVSPPLSTGEVRTRFPVDLAGPGNRRFPIQSDFEDYARARSKAQEVATHLGLPVDGLDPAADASFNRALSIFQDFGPERAIPVEQRWAREFPEIPGSAHAELKKRCEAIEKAAHELAMQVLYRMLTEEAARAELARRFPTLDADRLSRTWGQALVFASK
jgi:hypothetical protein